MTENSPAREAEIVSRLMSALTDPDGKVLSSQGCLLLDCFDEVRVDPFPFMKSQHCEKF